MYIKELTREQIEIVFNDYMQIDFPEDELKPLKRILEMLDDGVYFAAGLYDDDKLAGYAYFVRDKMNKTALLDYFAILKENRCKGYGSIFFDEALEFLSGYDIDNLYLETENIDFAKDEADKMTRTRRIAFYKKNGLVMSKIKSQLFGVDYNIMRWNISKLTSDSIETNGSLNEEHNEKTSDDNKKGVACNISTINSEDTVNNEEVRLHIDSIYNVMFDRKKLGDKVKIYE